MNSDLKKFTECFDYTYVLTIPRALERQQSIQRQFDGCNFEFLMGMDNKYETKENLIEQGIYDEVKARKNDSHKRALALGDVACSYGHTQIYRSILERNFKNVFIAEDDAIVNADIKNIDEIIKHIPKDADLIYWGWERLVEPGKFSMLKKMYNHLKLQVARIFPNRNGFSLYCFSVVDHAMVNNIYSKPYNKYFRQAGAHYCTHAYSITAKGCEVLLKMQTPVSFAADHLLINAILHKKLKAYIVIPQLFIQDYLSENASLPQYTPREYIQIKTNI